MEGLVNNSQEEIQLTKKGKKKSVVLILISLFLAILILIGLLLFKFSPKKQSNTPIVTKNKALDKILTNKPARSYLKQVIHNEPITLSGNETLEIYDTHYIQNNEIVLKDGSKLIIKNSSFEHRREHSFQYWLKAYDKSQVIVENSKVSSSDWLNWNFYNNSSLALINVDQRESNIWHYFPDDSKVTVKNSRFKGTLDNNAKADIDGSKDTFIELVLLPGSEVDETLPKVITNEYIFPNENDKLPGKMKLSLKNSMAPNWGITVTEEDKITIRDTENLTVTFSFGYKFINDRAMESLTCPVGVNPISLKPNQQESTEPSMRRSNLGYEAKGKEQSGRKAKA